MTIDEFTQFINQYNPFGKETNWILQVFLVVLGTLLLDFFQKRALNKIQQRIARTRTEWDDLVFESARKPVSLLIWLLGITLAADIVQQVSGAAIFKVIDPIRSIGVIFIISLFLLRLIRGTEEILIEREKKAVEKSIDKATVHSIGKLVRLSVIITSALVMLQTLGFSVSGVLAFGGIGGIAIGFAAKDLLANFFGGLMIYLDRPFMIGDWIRSSDRQIEGVVENIGWRLTCIRTFDKRPLYVPNSVFANIAVENPSRMSNRRIYETIGIRYADASHMAAIVADVKTMLKNHEAIDTSLTLMVNFNAFAASSIDFFVYTFTKTTDWAEYHNIKQDVLLKIMAIIESYGAEIAFPTSSLHIESLPEPTFQESANG